MPTTDAQRRANQKQDATRKRVAIWLDEKTAKQLDRQRGATPRAAFVRAVLAKAREKQEKRDADRK